MDVPFGGDSYERGTIASLRENSFQPLDVIQRQDGTLLYVGDVSASEDETGAAGTDSSAFDSGLGIAALDGSFALDAGFGGASSLRVSTRIVSTRLLAMGLAVRVNSSSAGVSVVTAKAAGRTIGRATVPLLIPRFGLVPVPAVTRLTARIPLTPAGRRLLRRRGSMRVRVTTNTADLVGNRVTARDSARLKPLPARARRLQ